MLCLFALIELFHFIVFSSHFFFSSLRVPSSCEDDIPIGITPSRVPTPSAGGQGGPHDPHRQHHSRGCNAGHVHAIRVAVPVDHRRGIPKRPRETRLYFMRRSSGRGGCLRGTSGGTAVRDRRGHHALVQRARCVRTIQIVVVVEGDEPTGLLDELREISAYTIICVRPASLI